MPLVPLANMDATDALARRLAPLLKAGDVVALYGGLGAGKTTFCRALISSLMGRETEVPSPTYTLVQTYEAPDFPVFHFDLYRLEDPSHLVELGWQETVDGVTLVEWPEHAGSDLPAWRLDIKLSISEKSRTAALEPQGEDWQTRLLSLIHISESVQKDMDELRQAILAEGKEGGKHEALEEQYSYLESLKAALIN